MVPQFTGPEADVTLAVAAWEAAATCAGRAPKVAPVVPIARTLDADPSLPHVAGLSSWADPGRAGIWLRKDAPARTLAHEVAHAWSHAGPLALVEGRTDLLTHCIQGARPDLFPGLRDGYSTLAEMSELRDWTEALERYSWRTADSYLASMRLFRAVAVLVPPERLWAEDLDSWAEVDALIAEAGPRAAPLAAVLAGGLAAQREALQDADLDGLSALYEGLTGTDPARWDSDGDGWWDGARPGPEGAVPLPRDRRPVCFPEVPAGAERLLVAFGGELGGLVQPTSVTEEGAPGMLVAWSPTFGLSPGGVWARPAGEGLVANPSCAMRSGVVARAKVPVGGMLDPLADALVDARAAVARVTGKALPTLVLSAGAAPAGLLASDDPNLGTRVIEVNAARLPGGRARDLAREIAAFEVASLLGGHDVDAAAAALIHATWDAPAPPVLLKVYASEVRAWRKTAERCAGGWGGLLSGTCARPG